jgi:hypothetical protein
MSSIHLMDKILQTDFATFGVKFLLKEKYLF